MTSDYTMSCIYQWFFTIVQWLRYDGNQTTARACHSPLSMGGFPSPIAEKRWRYSTLVIILSVSLSSFHSRRVPRELSPLVLRSTCTLSFSLDLPIKKESPSLSFCPSSLSFYSLLFTVTWQGNVKILQFQGLWLLSSSADSIVNIER